MPCSYYLPGEAEAIAAKEAKERLDLLKKELDLATRLLCEVCTKHPIVVKSNKEIQQWWKQHKIQDQKRIDNENKEKRIQAELLAAKKEKEKAIKSALQKLTPEEAKVLGLEIRKSKQKKGV